MNKLFLRSIQTREKLEIVYLSQGKSISQRTIRVIKLRENSILAYCYTKRKLRTFKLENILAADLLKKAGA